MSTRRGLDTTRCSSPPRLRMRRWRADEHAEPRRVDEGDAVEVGDDRHARMVAASAHELVAQAGHGRQIDLAGDGDHRHVAVLADAEAEIHGRANLSNADANRRGHPPPPARPTVTGSCTSSASRVARRASASWPRPLPRLVWQALGVPGALVAPGRGHRPRPGRTLGGRWPPARRRASRSSTRPRSPRRSRRDPAPLPPLGGLFARLPRARSAPAECRTPSRPTGPPGTALCIFPTKALAQDQLRALTALQARGLIGITYDGDTPPRAAPMGAAPRQRGAHQPRDAAHGDAPVPRSVGHLPPPPALRRRRRAARPAGHLRLAHRPRPATAAAALCAGYGASPTFVFSSATIGDPARLASDLCGLPVVAVTDDGSPRAERLFALWNPPLLDADTGARGSTNVEVARLTAALVEGGWRTVAFCRSRRGTEVVAGDVRHRLPPELADARAVVPRRLPRRPSGARSRPSCSPAASRPWWRRARSSWASTSAASTPACSTASRARSPRCGSRRGGPGGAKARRWRCSSAGADQLDQWLMAHPREVFTRPPEPAVVNLANPSVLLPQLACAAFEQPLTPADETWWGDAVDDGVRELVRTEQPAGPRRAGLLERPGFAGARDRPALRLVRRVPHRRRSTVGSSARSTPAGPSSRCTRARSTCTSASSTGCSELDLDDRVARVEPVDVDEYTQVRSDMTVTILGERRDLAGGRAVAALGGGRDRHPGRGL